MSAVAAIINWDGRPVELDVLHAANRALRHLCPDGSWAWVEGPVGLAQADLATLPEDRPGEPLERWGLRIAADCRIDNREALRDALPQAGLTAADPDAAYILAAYRAWGEGCAAKLLGDFAFVIWDGARLLAARDLSGARRLYYYSDRRRLLVATERLQILQEPTIALEVDEAQIQELLTPTFQWLSGWDLGLLRNLHAVPAGTLLSARAGHVQLRSFWRWSEVAPRIMPEGELIETYLHTLREALRCRLRVRGPRAGLEMSGGLDSTALVALAAGLAAAGQAPELHTLSLIFEQRAEPAERERIELMIARYGLPAHSIVADERYRPVYLNPAWQPQAFLGPDEIAIEPASDDLYKLAEANGIRVVLTGFMGDALNDGLPSVTYSLLRQGRYAEALRRLRLDWSRSRRGALKALAFELMPGFLPAPLRRAAVLGVAARSGPFTPLPDFIGPAMREPLYQLDWSLRARRTLCADAACPVVREALEGLFPPMVSVTAPSPAPVEIRHPYLDRRLIELTLAMPQDQKWDHDLGAHGAANRWHHRRALRGLVPDPILDQRGGMDFSAAIEHGYEPQALRAWLSDADTIHIFQRGYADPAGFLAALGRPGDNLRYLSSMLSLEAWLRAIAPGGALRRLVPPRQSLAAPGPAHPPIAVQCGTTGNSGCVAGHYIAAGAPAGAE